MKSFYSDFSETKQQFSLSLDPYVDPQKTFPTISLFRTPNCIVCFWPLRRGKVAQYEVKVVLVKDLGLSLMLAKMDTGGQKKIVAL